MFLIIVVLIFLVLFLPLGLIIEYKKSLSVKLTFLGFSVNLISKKIKIGSKSKKQKTDKKNNIISISDIIKKNGVLYLFKFARKVLTLISKFTKKILKKTKIKEFKLVLCISGEDALDISVKYGQACSVVYPSVSLINSICYIKNINIDIFPDFLSKKNYFEIKLDIKTKLFYVIYSVILFSLKYIKILKKGKIAPSSGI
ncbi:MAG: hypothetical protein RsTaC01_0033 [Candidatus Paraimprobicoccus trichonymphae]|uniref:DUF2953 domain-containing protein n=1 Tax=Candidatus Paraimprobicoccus trichonymphae TaxID=3033793 RepID=A0AA48HVS3_9FIRM|nr:MAG: hypothetical protein RsTaC01_0033 [Candidatus Paraimprobicoccus trichonymphae]